MLSPCEMDNGSVTYPGFEDDEPPILIGLYVQSGQMGVVVMLQYFFQPKQVSPRDSRVGYSWPFLVYRWIHLSVFLGHPYVPTPGFRRRW